MPTCSRIICNLAIDKTDSALHVTLKTKIKPMNTTLDPTKPVQTRDGRHARIITTTADNGLYPVIALVQDLPNAPCESLQSFTSAGRFSALGGWTDKDLLNVPVKHTVEFWVNFYENPGKHALHESRDFADRCAGVGRIACKKVTLTYTEGEGL